MKQKKVLSGVFINEESKAIYFAPIIDIVQPNVLDIILTSSVDDEDIDGGEHEWW